MSWFEAILLGLIQGVTEFLPVSSSGHLVITEMFLEISEAGLLFSIAVHAATLVAVVLFYRNRIAKLVVGASRADRDVWNYIAKLAVATLPIVGLVLVAREPVERSIESPVIAGFGLLFTGVLLWTTRSTLGRGQLLEPSWVGALAIGVGQAFAVLPGVSRSGTTVVVALFFGMAPLAAAEFSFLMAVVAISGAVVLKLPELQAASETVSLSLAIGSVVALVSGLAALWLFVRLLRDQRFYRFSYYVWTLGAVTLAWLYFS